jgi:arylsulfatase A-like enzyme
MPRRAAAIPWLRTATTTIASALAAMLALLIAGCERPGVTFPLRTAAGTPPNVLLVSIDTLRPDHLGAYGYPIATSPTIDALSDQGVRVRTCVASAPETAPAMASLLTGMYQPRTRVVFNRGTLPAYVQTLAEHLRKTGYATAGLIGNTLLDASRGFDQGFDSFEAFQNTNALLPSDDRGVDLALAWLAAPPKTPWFLWLHLIDPHGPYISATPSWSEDFRYPPDRFGTDTPIPPGTGNFGLGVVPTYQQFLGPDARPSDYVRRYDGEIRFADTQLERLFAAIDGASTLVVVTADHGESLTEHDEYFQHGWFLYDTTLTVPLVLTWPGVLPRGAVLDRQVSAVDVVPTILEIVGAGPSRADTDAVPLDGTSFAPAIFDDTAPTPDAAFAVGPRENHPFAVRTTRWKLIHTPADRPPVPTKGYPLGGFGTPERFELYDLRADPGETTNVVAQHPEIAADLKRRLAGFRATLRMSGRNW